MKEADETTRRGRQWLRKIALEYAHKAHENNPIRIIVMTHGGVLNYLTQEWDWNKDKGYPTNLPNLGVRVYSFNPNDEDEAKLSELKEQRAAYYKTIFGDNYVRFTQSREDKLQESYKELSGEFFERTRHETVEFIKRDQELLEALLSWTSAKDFLASFEKERTASQ
jgi:hypothetical protein